MKQDVSVELAGGKTISFETGKLAKQAHGSVVVRMGDNVVLATATLTWSSMDYARPRSRAPRSAGRL